MYEPSLMRGRDFKINDKITIHMPSVGDIIDYGEQKYFQLVYLFCSTSSDYKAQLDSVGVDWQKISDFEMFRQLFIGNKDQDMSILLGDMDTSGFMMAKDNISGEIVLYNRLTDTRIDHVVYETISQYLCAANGIEKHSEFAADGVLLGRFGQAVAAGLAAQTGQVALLDKALHDGLQILFGNFLPCGDLLQGDIAVVLVLGNINHNTQRITALR